MQLKEKQSDSAPVAFALVKHVFHVVKGGVEELPQLHGLLKQVEPLYQIAYVHVAALVQAVEQHPSAPR
jgi:hypothetical protein